ncbi:hypothetical protein BGZ73_002694 [Actinomortierella ambigua]|nr:hypothetical protein BGZ73_002694 [Actinomortierella ambigua]
MVGRPKRAAAQVIKSYAAETTDLGDEDTSQGDAKTKSSAKAKGKSSKRSKGRGQGSSDGSDSDAYQAQDDEEDEDDDEEVGVEESDEEDQPVEESDDDVIADDDDDGRGRTGKKRAGNGAGKHQQRGTLSKRAAKAFPPAWSKSSHGPTADDIGYFGIEELSLASSVFPDVQPDPSDFKVYWSSEQLRGKASLSSDSFSFRIGADEIELDGYHAHQISKEGSPSASAYIMNTGLGVWALDWAPLPESSRSAKSTGLTTDYIAVGGVPLSPGSEHNIEPLTLHAAEPYPNMIQIWGINCQADENNTLPEDVPGSWLEMCILHSHGAVLDLKWCSIGGHLDSATTGNSLDRLGILAASFGDGTIRFFVVPDPSSIRNNSKQRDNRQPLLIEFDRPFATFNLEGSIALSIAWGTEKRFAAGASDGRIYVWDTESLFSSFSRDMNNDESDFLQPFFVVEAHSRGVRCVDWARTSDGKTPHHIISCGFDGRFNYTDIRDIGSVSLIRGHLYVPHALAFIPWLNGHMYGEPDRSGRLELATAITPAPNVRVFAMPGNIWSLTYSDFHPYIGAGSEGGATFYANAVFNPLRTFLTPQTRLFGGKIVVETSDQANEEAVAESSIADPAAWAEQTTRAFESMEQEAEDLDAGGFAHDDQSSSHSESAINKRKRETYVMEGQDTAYPKHVDVIFSDVYLFPPSIGVRRVQWSRNHHSATWLASGIANGLLRVDNCRASGTKGAHRAIVARTPKAAKKAVPDGPKKPLGRPRKDPNFTDKEKKRLERAAAQAAKAAEEQAKIAERRERMERARAEREATVSEASDGQPQPATKLAPIFLASGRRSTRRGDHAGADSAETGSVSMVTETSGKGVDAVEDNTPTVDNAMEVSADETPASAENPPVTKIVPVIPKRGRPPKTKPPAPPAEDAPEVSAASTAAGDTAPADLPKPRGRPRKQKGTDSQQGDASTASLPTPAEGQQTLLSMQGVVSAGQSSSEAASPLSSPAEPRARSPASPAPSGSGSQNSAAATPAVPPSPRKARTTKKSKEELSKPNRSLKDMWGIKPSK